MEALRELRQAVAQAVGLGPSKSLADADALVSEGRYREAIEQLTALNRRARDPSVEKKLVELRHDGFARTAHEAPRPDWPPKVQDPFPSVSGPPEIRGADALTVERLAGGILHHGCLVVRGLLNERECKRLRDGIDATFDASDDALDGRANRETACWYSPLTLPAGAYVDLMRATALDVGAGSVLTGDSPRMLFEVVDLIHAKGVDTAIEGYLGERPALSLGKSTLRRMPPQARPGDWHQDGAFIGDATRTVNFWLSLSHCGEEAPSLDVVPRRLNDLAETGTHGACFDWSVGHEVAVRASGPSPIAHLSFAPGDAIFFDQLFLHRTSAREGMSKTRYAVETWFFAPSTYPLKWEPLLI